MNRIDQLNNTIEQERRTAKDYVVRSKVAERNGEVTKATEYDLMARLCYSQAEEAELEVNLLQENMGKIDSVGRERK